MEESVDGDGCVNIFPVLAQQLPDAQGKPRPFHGCRVAPTLTYKYQTKGHWYYSERKGPPYLVTRLKKELSDRAIVDGFVADDLMLKAQYEPKSEIIAAYIRSFRDPARDDGAVVTMFDYFDVPTLRRFLDAPPHAKQNNGILQRFVDSKGECNTMLRVTWTPRHAEVVRRMSKRPLGKGFVKNLNALYRRVATFEGPESLSRESTMTGHFPRDVAIEATEAIVAHLQQAGRSPQTIARIQLHFKVDKLDRVWLLWCSSLRLFHETPTLAVQVSPLVEIALQLAVPLEQRGSRYLGELAATPGGQEGDELEYEEAELEWEREREADADQERQDLELTTMLAAGMSGRHFPASPHMGSHRDVTWSGHDISQLHSPMAAGMAMKQNASHRATVAMRLSPETSEEALERPLLQPVEDFRVGSIYRRQSRPGVGRAGRKQEAARRRSRELRSRSGSRDGARSSTGSSIVPSPAGAAVRQSRSFEGRAEARGVFRHTDHFRERSEMEDRLRLPPAFAQVFAGGRRKLFV